MKQYARRRNRNNEADHPEQITCYQPVSAERSGKIREDTKLEEKLTKGIVILGTLELVVNISL